MSGRFFRDSCFVCRILGQALESEARNHAAVKGVSSDWPRGWVWLSASLPFLMPSSVQREYVSFAKRVLGGKAKSYLM